MKQFIKSSAACLLMGLALVSCNENFDEDMPKIAYPDAPSLGIWTNDLAGENDMKYTVNLTLNENGDTICDVTSYDPLTKRANVFSNGKAVYDKRLGMVVVDYEDSPFEAPARVAINYTNDLKGNIINVFSSMAGQYKSEVSFVSAKTQSVSVYGDWKLTDGTKITLGTDNTTAKINDTEEGTYQYAGTQGTITAGGKTYTMTLNEKGQMFFALNGANPMYGSHVMTPLPDDWVVYANGTYTSWLFAQNPFEGLAMEYSDYRGKGRISGVFFGKANYTFLWEKGGSTVTLLEASYQTGQSFQIQEGGEPYELFAVPTGKSTYSKAGNGMFTFGMEYGNPDINAFFPGEVKEDRFIVTEIVDF